MFTNADEVLRFIGDNEVEFVDVRFCDLPGTVQHFTVPAESFVLGQTWSPNGHATVHQHPFGHLN